jgi:hypothetical protein
MYEGTDYDVNKKTELYEVKNEAWESLLWDAVVETLYARE